MKKRRPAAPVGELWANGLKGTSVGLIALIFTRLADSVDFARLDGPRAPYARTVVSEFIINSWPSPFIHSYAYLYDFYIYIYV